MPLKLTKEEKRLDDLFQEYIRERDSRADGLFQCISCGRWLRRDGGNLHAGHYYSRKNMSVRWNEKNVNGQCRDCNGRLSGNAPEYAMGLVRKYGQQVLDELAWKKNQPWSRKTFNVTEHIKLYNAKLAELKRSKYGHP